VLFVAATAATAATAASGNFPVAAMPATRGEVAAGRKGRVIARDGCGMSTACSLNAVLYSTMYRRLLLDASSWVFTCKRAARGVSVASLGSRL
jgi:hypothetical protein